MVENLGLVGGESFAAIGANGKWQRRRGGYPAPLTLGALLGLLAAERYSAGEIAKAGR
jgi:hypothetical protein